MTTRLFRENIKNAPKEVAGTTPANPRERFYDHILGHNPVRRMRKTWTQEDTEASVSEQSPPNIVASQYKKYYNSFGPRGRWFKTSHSDQKRFTVDYLQKKVKVNEGEVPQYYVEHSHPAIVAPEYFDQVQEEIARRKRLGRSYRSGSIFSCRLVCGDCGEFFGPKVWNSTDKYRRVVWQCNAKFKGEHRCATPHLTEEAIKEKFIAAFNHLIPDRDRLIEDCRIMRDALCDCTEVDREVEEALQETEVLAEMVQRSVDENSSVALDQDAYNKRYDSLVQRYETARGRLAKLKTQRIGRRKKAEAFTRFMKRLADREESLTTFPNGLWIDSIDHVTVRPDGSLVFRFQNGREVTI